jgi:heptaprenylglyceryl phosphate synthase
MITNEQGTANTKEVFGDTKDISKAIDTVLKVAALGGSERYYIKEAQVQMTGLYAHALDLEKQVKQLKSQLKKATKVKPVKKAKKAK